jgi:hypothetical protein
MMRQQNWRQAQPSKLEQLCLEEQQFDTLVFMEELLAPFADAQVVWREKGMSTYP